MSKDETDQHAAPWCPIPPWHPARCHMHWLAEADKTLSRVNPLDLVDDYGKVEAQDWLSAPGGFR